MPMLIAALLALLSPMLVVAQAVVARDDAPLDASALRRLGFLIETYRFGEPPSEGEKDEIARLTRLLTTRGVQQQHVEDLIPVDALADTLGKTLDSVGQRLRYAKDPQQVAFLLDALHTIRRTGDAVVQGTASLRTIDYAKDPAVVADRERYSLYKSWILAIQSKRLAEHQDPADWSYALMVRLQLNYISLKSQELLLRTSKLRGGGVVSGQFELLPRAVRRVKQYEFRYVNSTMRQHMARGPVVARDGDTLVVVDAILRNNSGQTLWYSLNARDVALVSGEQQWPLMGQVYGPVSDRGVFRGLGGFDVDAGQVRIMRVKIDAGESIPIAYIFPVKSGQSPQSMRVKLNAVGRSDAEAVEIETALFD